MPLALASVLFNSFFALSAITIAVIGVTNPHFPHLKGFISVAYAAFELTIITTCLTATIRRSLWLTEQSVMLIKIGLVGIVVELVIACVLWGVDYSLAAGLPRPSLGIAEILGMVIEGVLYVLLFLMKLSLLSVFESLCKIFEVGGTGWERRNYTEIQAEKSLGRFKTLASMRSFKSRASIRTANQASVEIR